jgi:hypothetical protein
MMASGNEIERALAMLDTPDSDANHPAAMIVLPPGSGDFIIGNRDGFVRLARAALRAAQGEQQSFKDASWVCAQDLNWSVAGLKMDESAHIYLPVKLTRFEKLRQSIFGLIIVALVLICLFVGFVTVVRRMLGWI